METPSDHQSAVITAQDVGVEIDAIEILRDVSFHVQSGQFVGLVGPNGSGKTTLLRAVSGLIPFHGEILLGGKSIRRWKPRRLARELAFVRQSASLSFDFTVVELVLMGRTPHKGWLEGYGSKDRMRAEGALHQVDLGGFEDRSVLSLSGGELQRVFLAQALVQEAGVLLLDEPIAHLDVHYQFEFMDLVSDLVRGGRTVVSVFHDLVMAARYAHELLVLSRGRLVASGAPSQVLTSELLAEVFRMDARISTAAEGHTTIEYKNPIANLEPIPK